MSANAVEASGTVNTRTLSGSAAPMPDARRPGLDVAPLDVPEGVAQVLVSVTLFVQWAEQLGLTVTRWGEPEHWDGDIYSPTITKPMVSAGVVPVR